MKLTLLNLCFVVTLLASAPANAQPTEERASRHFEQGVELYHDGNLDAALIEFERAYELAPNYRLLFNLAQVQTERMQYVLAIELFKRYLSEGKQELTEDRKAAVESELSKLRKRVANLWVKSNVAGAELFINEVSVGKLPLSSPVLINSGVCRIRLEKPGYVTHSQRLPVAGEEHPRLSIQLAPVTNSAAPGAEKGEAKSSSVPETSVDAPEMRPNRTAFWITAATTGVLAGAATTFGVLTLKADSKLDDELDEFPSDEDEIDSLRKKVKTYSILTDSLGAGAIVSAGFAIYFLINPAMVPNDTAQVGVDSLRLVPRGAGMALTGQF